MRKQRSNPVAVPVVLCDLNLGLFFSILCGPCPPHQKNKETSYNKRWKHKWELLKWQQKIPAHVSQPHATTKTITDNVTASTYACRTIICILPPCPACVMEMPGLKFEQHKCLLAKQSSSESPGTQSSLLQGIAIEKVDEQNCFSSVSSRDSAFCQRRAHIF